MYVWLVVNVMQMLCFCDSFLFFFISVLCLYLEILAEKLFCKIQKKKKTNKQTNKQTNKTIESDCELLSLNFCPLYLLMCQQEIIKLTFFRICKLTCCNYLFVHILILFEIFCVYCFLFCFFVIVETNCVVFCVAELQIKWAQNNMKKCH